MTHPLRLLIVEDSKEDASLLLRALRSGGYEPAYEMVDTAPAMRAALEQRDWNLVISDCCMPRFGATAALALAKELRADLPFVVVSSSLDLNLAVSLIKAGASDYIQKSELTRLVPVVTRLLHETQAPHEPARTEQGTAETRYHQHFEEAQAGILILNAETGQVTDINPFLVQMLGYSRDHCVGRKLWEIGAFKDFEACKSGFLELQSKGHIRYEHLPLETSSGRSIEVEFVSAVYLADGERVIQCNIQDITERIRLAANLSTLNGDLERHVRARTAQLEAINQELETFNYAVSHDLCAPLRRIRGFAEVLEEDYPDKLDSEGQKLIRAICHSTEHMGNLIDGLLKLSRITRSEITLQPNNVSAMVHAIAEKLQQGDPARHVEFVVAEGIMANGDSALLRVLLENLLDNSWKFTNREAAARIEFGAMRQSNGILAYFVTDNGTGFDMKYADKLFGAFQRFHDEDEFPGIGIGLASVQRIVHRHKGRTWAQSTEGQGATFYFTLESTSGTGPDMSSELLFNVA